MCSHTFSHTDPLRLQAAILLLEESLHDDGLPVPRKHSLLTLKQSEDPHRHSIEG